MAYRPSRILYGYTSASVQPLNISLPWVPSTQDGMFKMNRTPEEAERDNLLFWAQTNWGEIPYKFKFGLDAQHFLFDPDVALKQKIIDNARSQLKKYFGYLKILKLDVFTSSEDSNLLSNQIRFYLLAETPKGKEIEIQQIIGNA